MPQERRGTRGIDMPTEVVVPPGAVRDLLLALHELYINADRPGVREIESAIQKDNDLPGTMNKQTVSDVLSGRAFSRLNQAKALAMFFAKRAGTDPKPVGEQVGRLWKEADRERRRPIEQQAVDGHNGQEYDGPPQPGSLLHVLHHLEDELFPHEIESDIALMVTGPADNRWEALAGVLGKAGSALVVGRLTHWQPGPDEPVVPLLGSELACYESTADPAERRRLLGTRMLVRHSVATAAQIEPHQVVLRTSPGGRLSVRGMDRINISLTLDGDLAVVGLTEIGRIGVGIATAESVADRPAEELLDVLAPHEVDFLRSIPPGERMPRLMNLWVLKDAYTKAIGQGRRFSYPAFGFTTGDSATPTAFLSRESSSPHDDAWSFATYSTGRGHRIGVAVCDAGFSNTRYVFGGRLKGKLRKFLTD
ncbi:4'-phosphopantetheinyl transferase superfamily protein [Streptomyces sp. NPDC029721]|uniref:4'-phosphopantetheinyl transferase family protein n=1 Tax=Streptomyces sp. NPDC029721 TaxID=3157090 RepID=UPI0033CFB818